MTSRQRVIDTNILVSHWHRSIGSARLADKSAEDARRWARQFVQTYRVDAIVTPVDIEFRAGTRNDHELKLARAYLAEFHAIDDGEILAEDWEAARRHAERIPRHGKPRHLGDCLIRAIANRLHREVWTDDADFPI